MNVKQVIVIRKDLNMRKGKMVSQGAHASMACLTNNLIGYPFSKLKFPFKLVKFLFLWFFKKEFRYWFTNDFRKICVYVESEKELLEIYDKAKLNNLICSIIKDNGRTEFKGIPTFTSVAIGPDYSEKIDSITGKLTLL
jgi:peptidyl-tRNA hydrolase, PTH2 family